MVNRHYQFPGIDRRLKWIGLGLFTLIVDGILSYNPSFAEVIYSRGIFTLWRWIFDYTVGLSPVPLMYIGIGIILYLIARKVLTYQKRHGHQRIRNKIASFGLTASAILGGAYFFFQFLWGFNYHRVPVATYLELPEVQINAFTIESEYHRITPRLIEARNAIHQSGLTELHPPKYGKAVEDASREALAKCLKMLEYPTPGRVRCREILPKGSLMRWGATGIYLPYLSEGSFDGAIHPAILPFTAIHEMAHGYGFGDEGIANFLAYLSATQSDDPFIRYAGWLAYWRHVARQLYILAPERYETLILDLPLGIRSDLKAVREAYQKHPALFPILFRSIYDRYLKWQGIKEGTYSYDKVVALAMAWELKLEEEGKK